MQLQFEEKVGRTLLPLREDPRRRPTAQSNCMEVRPPPDDYCLVCLQQYQDYLEHIAAPPHTLRLANNNTNRSI